MEIVSKHGKVLYVSKTASRIKDLIEEAVQAKIDLTDADFKDQDLSYSNLCGSVLAGAQLQRSNLEGADLDKARLNGANLEKARLQNASLNETSAVWCNFSQC